MSDITNIETQLTTVLNKAAKELNLKKYSLNLNLQAQKGDGFLGELYKVSIIDDETNTKIDLVLKKAPEDPVRREESSIEFVYKNETLFYSIIFPALKKFQDEHRISEPFDSIPAYITSVGKLGEEIIVLKDITSDGFTMREKDLLLDDEHARFIFSTYGRFHALSFCLKDQKPEEFDNLTQPIFDMYDAISKRAGFNQALTKIAKKSLEALDPNTDKEVAEKFKKYVDGVKEIFSESSKYKGKYSGILHGDCWSNNLMFKYQDSKLQALSLLDFQLIRVGTPVHDLSYFFYTGGSKELFDKLEEYLDVYHESFSRSCKKLGCDPEKLLPKEQLTEDWKIYSRFGMLMSLILIKIKLMSKEDSIELAKSTSGGADSNGDKFMKMGYNEELFNKRVRDILVHLYEIDAL